MRNIQQKSPLLNYGNTWISLKTLPVKSFYFNHIDNSKFKFCKNFYYILLWNSNYDGFYPSSFINNGWQQFKQQYRQKYRSNKEYRWYFVLVILSLFYILHWLNYEILQKIYSLCLNFFLPNPKSCIKLISNQFKLCENTNISHSD